MSFVRTWLAAYRAARVTKLEARVKADMAELRYLREVLS